MRLPKSKTARTGSRKAVVLPNNACPSCGTMTVERRGVLKLPVNGEMVAVPSVPHLACPKCGEVLLRWEDSGILHEGAIAIYRKRHGLLSGEDIRAIRGRFGLTQAELARLLHLGANTVSRWEAGRNVQTEAMEMLLRMLRDLPGAFQYLRKQAA